MVTDHVLSSPGSAPAPVADAMASFTREELVELMLAIGLFHGFSKLLIALDAEPEAMERTELPTPTPKGVVTADGDPTNPYGRLLADRPDLASAWLHMEAELHAVEGLPAEMLDAVEARSALLHGVGEIAGSAATEPEGDGVALARELTELFSLDVRGIGDAHRVRIGEVTDGNGFVGLLMAIAVYDGIHRFAASMPV